MPSRLEKSAPKSKTSPRTDIQGARPRIIRITRSCRTESRIGCIGIGANPTCWRLTIGGVAMISDERDRTDGDPESYQVGHVHRTMRARQGASRIRHLRLAVTRGFRFPSFHPIILQTAVQPRFSPSPLSVVFCPLYFAPFSWTTYLEAMRGNPARISFNPLLTELTLCL